ncbi:hypothetical protein AB732_004834 [Escherichia coli]|nr:hypothetical protein [Escherichia coli]
MYVRSRLWLTILSLFLTLWLISGFLPLSAVNQIIMTLVSVVAAGLVLWYQWRCLSSRRDIPENAGDDGLPPEYFQGHILLVAGNSDAWFESGQAYRETASGWYPVRHFYFFFSICWRVLKKEFSILNTDLMRLGYGEGR